MVVQYDFCFCFNLFYGLCFDYVDVCEIIMAMRVPRLGKKEDVRLPFLNSITEEERKDLQRDVDEVFENDISLLEKFHIMEKLLKWKKKLDKVALFTYDKGLKTMMVKFALCYKRGMMKGESFFVNIGDLPYKTTGLLVSLKEIFFEHS